MRNKLFRWLQWSGVDQIRLYVENDYPYSNTRTNVIKNEIRHAQLYVDIQNMRFEDRVCAHWELDPSASPASAARGRGNDGHGLYSGG
ncbi:histidine kinase [Lachnoclostridium sp. Marseille-P6806]|uniref:histidine kinase n=1 Tax=Lachnoclostridium sp. Marseille-P6806 TaxID=2364793 RepID=UPI001030C962|nr:histidine kinase [Lachnoclostridium sp. Marseille-P6806]